jgi:hypothetical protein
VEKTLLSRQSPKLLGTPAESRDFLPLLRWLIIVSLTGFGAIVLWRLGLIGIMLETDRTHISSLILALFVLTSLHCLVQTWFVSSEITQVRFFREMLHREHLSLATFPSDPNSAPQDSIVARHVANLVAKARAQKGRRVDQTLLLRTLADQLRSREKIVGFILMLIPIAKLTAFDAESLRKALAGMSSGMAIALNVTVTGIATALLLKLQYFYLDKAIGELFSGITELTEVHIVSALERDSDG